MPDRPLDDFQREAVAAVADLSHHRWSRLKVTDGKPNGHVTMPLCTERPGFRASLPVLRRAHERCREPGFQMRVNGTSAICRKPVGTTVLKTHAPSRGNRLPNAEQGTANPKLTLFVRDR